MKNKFSIAMSLAVVLAMLLTSLALADNISNNLDASVDAVAEVMSLNVGGANGTTQLYVVPANGDGKNGCNLTGATTLAVSVSSNNTSVATVSPSSVTFTSCGDTPTLTITPHNQGSATISLSQTSNTTGGTFDLGTATFTVNVAPPANTAPQITISGVNGGDSYEIGSVPAATCDVTDAEDGSSSFAATLSAVSGPLAAYGLGEQTASCSYTDAGGLTASASVTYGIVDTTAPVITYVSRTPANGNGWNNGDVTVTWSCTDSGSGVVSATVTQTVSTEGANQSATGTCTDNAGNTAPDTQTGINIDKTAPTISASISPAAAGTGWYNSTTGAPTVSFTCNDGGSGLAGTCPGAVALGEGADQSVSGGPVSDLAGNTSSLATISNIDVDLTAPSVSLVGGPANGGSYYFGSVPAAPTCNASDATSGLAGTCSVTGYSAAVGSHTVTASATDNAGNSNSASASYTVLAWTLNGFYQPVDMTPAGSPTVWNTVKNGSTVPLKFEVFAGSTELTDTAIVNQPLKAVGVTCSTGTADDIELLSSGNTSLRYDTTGGQFIYNWQTPKKLGACYMVTVSTIDGSSISAYFKLK